MTNSNTVRFHSEVLCLQDLSDEGFSIPTYQRPYVWDVEQIDKLLRDCANAFSHNKNKPYFIGTILTDRKKHHTELIDGQQRFTTLWLIAFVYYQKKIESDITKFLEAGDKLRLDFEIRKEVSNYFGLLVMHPEEALTKYDSDELKEKPYLLNIVTAVTTISGILDTLENTQTQQHINLKEFGDFLYTQLKLVNNITPNNEKFDLNKLFATVNNSGIQLEQTDIVKSNLLNKIKTDKVIYSKIWESCENMSEYFERNVRKVFDETNWKELNPADFAVFDREVFRFESTEQKASLSKGFTVEEILSGEAAEIEATLPNQGLDKPHEINCESVLNFAQLLVHTYRIFLYRNRKEDFKGTFHVDRLITIFKSLETEGEEKIKEFLELLWQVRYVFDNNIIKWITDLETKERHLELTSVAKTENKDNTYFVRNVLEKSNLLMLQSVLYYTGDYLRQYWLTPYLNHLLQHKKNDIIHLEKIDNQMSLNKKSDKESSYILMDSSKELSKDFDLGTYLRLGLGTSFQHYWFLKLEYVLWKYWNFDKDDKFKNYRITSKNSVEHIFPQNPKFSAGLPKEHLDSFGNLVLLSVSQNSEYSRKEVSVKRAEFKSKKNHDTLKSYHIFNSYNEWNISNIKDHREKMIIELVAHYATSSFYNSPQLD